MSERSRMADEILLFCIGIVFCAWYLDAKPDQAALIRLPAMLYIMAYALWVAVSFFRRRSP